MKSKLAILALLLVCLWGSPAKADTVFTYSSGIFTGSVEFAPGAAIPFDYSLTWDGITLTRENTAPSFADFIISGNTITDWELDLTNGQVAFWSLHFPAVEPSLSFDMVGSGTNPFYPELAYSVNGAWTEVTTTPEPATAILLLLAIGLLCLLYTASKG